MAPGRRLRRRLPATFLRRSRRFDSKRDQRLSRRGGRSSGAYGERSVSPSLAASRVTRYAPGTARRRLRISGVGDRQSRHVPRHLGPRPDRGLASTNRVRENRAGSENGGRSRTKDRPSNQRCAHALTEISAHTAKGWADLIGARAAEPSYTRTSFERRVGSGGWAVACASVAPMSRRGSL
jgi:hypothetical protein